MKVFIPSRKLLTPQDQGADFVELFFDLVFVFAITRITSITAHHLDLKHVVQSVLIFWLIWWAWTLLTYALNSANTRFAEIRMTVLLATAVAFLMATSVGEAFGENVMWFAIPYIIIHTMGVGLYIRVTYSKERKQNATLAFGIISLLSFVAIIIGALSDPSNRLWWWIGAIIINAFAALVGGNLEGWKLYPKHLAERHGLIVIIALGESLIVAANAVSNNDRSTELLVVGGLTVLVTCLLWWTYFAWINEHLEEFFAKKEGNDQVKVGRDIYSFIHFPIIAGIIGIAIGFEKLLSHPGEMLGIPVVLTFAMGFALFIGFTGAAVYRISKILLVPRLSILAASLIGFYFSIGQPPILLLGIASFGLILLVLIEWKKCRLMF